MPSSRRAGAGRPDAAAAAPGADLRRRAREIARRIIAEYPDARCMLDHADPFQLLVATILAAQCTDERVNMTTPALFRRFPTPRDLAAASLAELEGLVRSTGFFRSKARNIRAAAETLVREFPSGVPSTMQELLRLPGVGRKTANVILGTCVGAPAIIVDTHVRRVARRLGLASSADPDRIEEELCALLPAEVWTAFSHALTFHGRRVCAARAPDHGACVVRRLCPIGKEPTR
jgi:endonuclease III